MEKRIFIYPYRAQFSLRDCGEGRMYLDNGILRADCVPCFQEKYRNSNEKVAIYIALHSA